MLATIATPKTINKAALFRDLGYEPHPGQRLVHQSSAPRRVLAAGVRWGKTRCAAMEALVGALQPRNKSVGWIIGPTYDLADRVFREIIIIAAEHLRHRIVSLRESEKRLVLRNMAGGISELKAKSSDNPISLLGEGLFFAIIDEAARMKPHIWESHVSQRLVDQKESWALLISTPKGKGWFFDSFRRGQGLDAQYESWNSPSWMNPHLDRELIERERTRLPERVFRQEYGGEFIEGSGSVFRNVRECATGTFKDPVRGEVYFGGLDLAKVEDFTVLTIMNRSCEVVFLDRYNKIDWAHQVDRIKAATDRYNRPAVYTDTTGAGEPVYEEMRRAGVLARPYPFTMRSKAALVDSLAIALERKQIILPQPHLAPALIDELESFEYSVSDSGNVKTSAAPGLHDDCVMSLALATWKARPQQSGFKVW